MNSKQSNINPKERLGHKYGDLHHLINPASIAFIGASQRPNFPASRALRHCIRLGFKGDLYPINPKYESLFGAKCYPTLASLPKIPDLVMIAIDADSTIELVEECKVMGVKTVIACSSGWDEIGDLGIKRSNKLKAILKDSNLRLLGPNCLGAGNAEIGLSLGFNSSFESISFPRLGQIGLISQSGAMLGGLILNAEDQGADLAAFVHVGNALDISLEEAIHFMLSDPKIQVVAAMIEGLQHPELFIEAARLAKEIGKPLVVFKAGSSEQGQKAVQSHTGALAGSDLVFSTVCDELGIIRVEEPEDLLPTAALITSWGKNGVFPIKKGNILVYTLSGGAASIIADECASAKINLPELSPAIISREKEILPSFTTASNPFDIGGGVFSDPDLPKKALEIAVEDPNIEAVVWVGVGAPRDERSLMMINQALDVFEASGKPGIIVPVSGYPQEPGFLRARNLQIPVLRSLRAAIKTIAAVKKISQPKLSSALIQPKKISQLPAGIINEKNSKKILSEIGIQIPASTVTTNDEIELSAAAKKIGYPIVLKGMADNLIHKSELGLVALNIKNEQELIDAVKSMRNKSQLNLNQFLIEKMIFGGIEVVVGVKKDPQFGQIMMFGLGGVAVELFKDVSFGMCPLKPEKARAMIESTKASLLLKGFRGKPPADIDALISAMVKISHFAASHSDQLQEMDINPILVFPKGEGILALDAVLVVNKIV